MRRIILGIVALGALVPAAARANDVPDGKACRARDQVTVVTAANGSTEPDRLAICVTQGGHTLYFGGEMQSEDPRNDGFAGTCGAIIVDDVQTISGKYGEDWDDDESNFHC